MTCTEFQVHISQQEAFEGTTCRVFDYTEHRLRRYSKLVKDPQQRQVIVDLLNKYIKGNVAICWKSGLPSWLDLDM